MDWLPVPAVFAGYQLAGWAGRRLARPLADALLFDWDRRIFGADPGLWLVRHLPGPGLGLLELFYFSYYVLVPFAPWALCARKGRYALWHLWTTVSVAYLICDLLFPWFPSTPPRMLFREFGYGGWAQGANLWILNRFSIHANVFPSSHVAAAVTFALCHVRYHKAGRWFLLWAAAIAVATVSGGYHYGIDAAGGIAIGVVADWIGTRLFRRYKPTPQA